MSLALEVEGYFFVIFANFMTGELVKLDILR